MSVPQPSQSFADQAPAVEGTRITRCFDGAKGEHRALRDVSFTIGARRTLAVVGESGAGKSTLARVVAGLDRPTSGRLLVGGRDVSLRYGEVSPVQMIYQHPTAALNRYLNIRRSVEEPLRGRPSGERRRMADEMLAAVGIDPDLGGRRPGEFSGGQLQRIVIARALVARPSVLVCDEPTSALDVSVQAQIVNLLLDLQSQLGFACVLVTHDLGVVRVLGDEVMVLRRGVVEELTPAQEFFRQPRSSYGRSLLASSLTLGGDADVAYLTRHLVDPSTQVGLMTSDDLGNGAQGARTLVSALEPYGGQSSNISEKMLCAYRERASRGVASVVLPVEFDRACEQLWAAVKRTDADLVIACGQADEGSTIRVERFAMNVRATALPDNAGWSPIDSQIEPQGPIAYETTLPYRDMVGALKAAGVPAEVSYAAGTYVCNDVFYGLMHRAMLERRPLMGGFIHVPKVLTGVNDRPTAEALADALELIVQVGSEARARDLRTVVMP